MAVGGERGTRRASVPETVGAWLGLWTPPRDVVVPAVPVRALLAAGAALVVLAAVAVVVVAPAIDDSKDRAAARDAREAAQRREANRRRTIAEQRPRRLDLASLRPPADAPSARRIAARTTLLERAEAAISADARERAAAGELEGNPRGTECEPYPERDPGDGPERDLRATRGVYDCLVFVRAIASTETNIGGQLGYPFRAVLDFESFSATWCKTNPVPGERVVPDPRTVVELPPACRKG
jgi:hypothetical protein